MRETPGRGETGGELGIGIWTFFVWKTLGLLWTLAYLAFAALWVLPRFTQAGAAGSPMRAAYARELATDGAEAVLTVVGLVLIVRRQRFARWYWMVLLCLYCLARLGETLLGPEPFLPAVLFLTGVMWLAYWVFGRKPRELAFARHWAGPA